MVNSNVTYLSYHQRKLLYIGSLKRMEKQQIEISVLAPFPTPLSDAYAEIAVSYYEGTIDLWVNRELILGVTDSEPFERGSFGFEIPPGAETPRQFDNIVVCSLNEPYTPPPRSADDETVFRDAFDGSLDESWEWLNEDPSAWQITDEGWLEITAA